MDEPSVDDLVERLEQIIEWSRNLNARERETMREAVTQLRSAHPVLVTSPGG